MKSPKTITILKGDTAYTIKSEQVSILHDLKHIANSMRQITLEAENSQSIKHKVLVLSQHLEKLYKDLERGGTKCLTG